MIVSIFGIPRSGKTTLIKHLVKTFAGKAISLKKKVILNKYALQILNKSDKDLSLNEMTLLSNYIEKELHSYEKKYEYIFLDCHIGYLVNGEWVEFRPKKFHQIGDVFVYLYTSAKIVFERMENTQGIKAYYNYTIDDLIFYRDKELKRLNEIISSLNSPVIVLNNCEKYYDDIKTYLFNFKAERSIYDKKEK